MAAIAVASLVVSLILATLVILLITIYSSSRTVLNADYTQCQKLDSNITCLSLIAAQSGVYEPIRESCKCKIDFELDSDINHHLIVYYGLDGFYQNFRFLSQSTDRPQLRGMINARPAKYCQPQDSHENKTIVPCGALANAFFDDEFTILHEGNKSIRMDQYEVPVKRSRGFLFVNPPNIDSLKEYSKPRRWPKALWQLDMENPQNNALENGPFIVWMTVSTFSDFIKMYSLMKPPEGGVFRKGSYSLLIEYRYGASPKDFHKHVIIKSVGWFGVQNTRFLLSLVVLAIIYFIIFLVTFLFWMR